MLGCKKNGFLIQRESGDIPYSPLSLPYFDDVVLTHAQVEELYVVFKTRKKQALKTPGLKNNAVDQLEEILDKIIDAEQGLSTCAD